MKGGKNRSGTSIPIWKSGCLDTPPERGVRRKRGEQ